MLITFKTNARYPNITMFGDVALQLLKLMGRRDTVPSAIKPEDIPDALNQLRTGLAIQQQAAAVTESTETDDDEDPAVNIDTRAGPLIEMLEAALSDNVPVMWQAG